jgi:hypothetical protein
MKKKSIGLILLLTLSMISMIVAVTATPVTYPSTSKNIIWLGGGYTAYQTLAWNPEYLKLRTAGYFTTNTTIIVQGLDTYGQNIEALVVLNATHDHPIPNEREFIFNDTHTVPPQPVAFAAITAIFQQNGTHNDKVLIRTEPEPFQEYLGEFHYPDHWTPGTHTISHPGEKYLVGHGDDTIHTTQGYPVEPSNPDPIKVAINWYDADHDLFPDNSEIDGAYADSTLTIEGLDENGNKLIADVVIAGGAKLVDVVPSPSHTWATICKIKGGDSSDSYYIFTHPTPTRPLFSYTLLIDHITIHPGCYDILANPQAPGNAGQTTITVALRDKDGNLIHAAKGGVGGLPPGDIVVNFATSGGKIQPSCDVWIHPCNITATATLTADTNARTIKVTADANVPQCSYAPELNLFAWTELTFDGINSVFFTGGWPIHTMMWGWSSWNDTALYSTFTGPVPPKPVLPDWLGGPAKDGIKLDGPIYEVMIPLYVGCNLISCPVHPMLGEPDFLDAKGIPMSLLFGNTSATTCIEAIWWYNGSDWFHYIPGVDGSDQYFTDGVGYWIYAEKPCTLEISGVFMDNAPFTPPTYTLAEDSWNLMGVTSLTGISIEDYTWASGPVWVYQAQYGTWYRNPSWGLWPGQAFWIYNAGSADVIAP